MVTGAGGGGTRGGAGGCKSLRDGGGGYGGRGTKQERTGKYSRHGRGGARDNIDDIDDSDVDGTGETIGQPAGAQEKRRSTRGGTAQGVAKMMRAQTKALSGVERIRGSRSRRRRP